MIRKKGVPHGLVSVLCLLTVLLATAWGQSPATRPARRGAGNSGNRLHMTPNDVHGLLIDEAEQLSSTGAAKAESDRTTHTSRVISTSFPFNDLVPSWNVDVPKGGGFAVEIRLGRKEGDFWTPFYYLGSWGTVPSMSAKVLKDENGIVYQDYFQSTNRFDRLQYRFHLAGPAGSLPVIRRVAMAYSNTLNDAELAKKYRERVDPGRKEQWARRLPVPFRSQNWEDYPLRGQICSPTSTSMVLEYYGVKLPTVDVCRAIWDPEYKLYGNWWRAVQGAYALGVSGYLERFGDFEGVKRHIAAGRPVIASVRINLGDLRNFPQRFGGGHLVVIVGFDADGNILLNDPAGRSAERGQITIYREDMVKIWLARGGVGYVLQKPKLKAEI